MVSFNKVETYPKAKEAKLNSERGVQTAQRTTQFSFEESSAKTERRRTQRK